MYISNVVKYRPPENRDPDTGGKERVHMPETSFPIVKPKVIVAARSVHSLGHFFSSKPITEAHGKLFQLTDDLTVFLFIIPPQRYQHGISTEFV